MTSLYVDRRGVSLSLDSDAIAFHQDGTRIGTVPLAPLERVYLRGDVRLSSSVLGRMGAAGIGVVILSGRKSEPTLFLPRRHNDARIRTAQWKAASDAAITLRLARWLVEGKVQAQHRLLGEIHAARPDSAEDRIARLGALARMCGQAAHKPCVETLRGLEGAAAAQYFSGFTTAFAPGLGFTARNRRPPRDPVNAALSLSYTLLHAEAVLAAHGHGFDPHVGFLHALDFGRESFACDLVEPLRPMMDRFVWRLFADQTLRERDFSIERNGSCLLQKAGRDRYYAAVETPLTEARKRLDRMLVAMRALILGEGRAIDEASDAVSADL